MGSFLSISSTGSRVYRKFVNNECEGGGETSCKLLDWMAVLCYVNLKRLYRCSSSPQEIMGSWSKTSLYPTFSSCDLLPLSGAFMPCSRYPSCPISPASWSCALSSSMSSREGRQLHPKAREDPCKLVVGGCGEPGGYQRACRRCTRRESSKRVSVLAPGASPRPAPCAGSRATTAALAPS
jgi:hypothetical protein